MRCEFLGVKGSWKEVYDAALTTIGKESNKEPSSEWKRSILLSEHSPCRKLIIKAKWHDLKYWVSVHLVRHKIGIEHFVRTQRTDRTHIDRDQLKQSAKVEHEIEVNAQAIINISRKRLCNMASKETRDAWQAFLNSFKDAEPELYSVCVRECVYRYMCPEFKSCGYFDTLEHSREMIKYREGYDYEHEKLMSDLNNFDHELDIR